MMKYLLRSASKLMALLLLAACFLHVSAAPDLLAGWAGANAYDHSSELESISSLLTARGGSEIQALVNAKRIVQDLSSSSSCTYGPTARLLKQCKVIKPKTQDPTSDQQKANVQATYGISMALCEARQAQVSIPSACYVFETMLGHPTPDSSIVIARSADIQNCMNELFDTASWTSYIAFRAQSADLCDSSRVDYQREELLETYRQATNVIPEILEALKGHHSEIQFAMSDLRELAINIAESQQNVITSNHEQTEQSKQYLHQMSQYVESYMAAVEDSGKSWRASMNEAVEQAVADLALMNDKVSNVQVNFAELYATAAEALSGMTYNFETSVATMTKEASNFVERLLDLNIDDQMLKIQQGMSLGQAAAIEFAETQSMQTQVAQEQLSDSYNLLQIIKDSHGQFHQIKQTLDLVPTSWIENVHRIQQIFVRMRAEATYALLFWVPSLLLLLFGRSHLAAVVSLIYVLTRLIWSVAYNLPFSMSDIPISIEDMRLLALCSAGAIFAGGSAAIFGGLMASFLARRRKESRATDTESASTLVNRRSAGQFSTKTREDKMFRQCTKQDPVVLERSTRWSTVPPNMP